MCVDNRTGENMADEIIEAARPIWNPDGYAEFSDGTRVSLKNGCLHCPYSLMYCQCHLAGRVPMAIHPRLGYTECVIRGGVAS